MNEKIISYKNKNAVFSKDNIPLSAWYDRIFRVSKNIYLLVDDNQMALAKSVKSKGVEPIKWHARILPEGIVKKKSSYYVAQNKNSLLAIYDADGQRKSTEWAGISVTGLVNGDSEYYIASDSSGSKAIFQKDGRRVSKWFKDISEEGLVRGQSDYYVATTVGKDGKDVQAIFNKSGKQVTPWERHIYPYGAVEGLSKYYVARSEDLTAKLMHLSGKVIIDNVTDVRLDGAVRSQKSSYVIVYDKGRDVVYKLEDDEVAERVIEAETVWPDGLVNGDSEYCVTFDGEHEFLYHRQREIVGYKKSILAGGLLRNEAEFYAAKEKDKTWSVYDKHGHTIASDLDRVFDGGLLRGKSNYVLASKNDEFYIFHKDYPELNLTPQVELRYGRVDSLEKARSIVENKASISYLTQHVVAVHNRDKLNLREISEKTSIDYDSASPKRKRKKSRSR